MRRCIMLVVMSVVALAVGVRSDATGRAVTPPAVPDLVLVQRYAPWRTRPVDEKATVGFQLSDWMAALYPLIANQTLLDLSLPGTHDRFADQC